MNQQNHADVRQPGPYINNHEPELDGLLRVVWTNGTVACLWKRHGIYSIEVRLALDGVVIQREFFTDVDSASQFALGKKRAYANS